MAELALLVAQHAAKQARELAAASGRQELTLAYVFQIATLEAEQIFLRLNAHDGAAHTAKKKSYPRSPGRLYRT